MYIMIYLTTFCKLTFYIRSSDMTVAMETISRQSLLIIMLDLLFTASL